MKCPSTHLALSLTAAAAFAGSASAAPLTTFVFDGSDTINETEPYTGGSTSSAENVTIVSGFEAGDGFRGLGNSSTEFRAFDFVDGDGTGSPEAQTLSQAIAQDEFLRFTVQADAGSQLDLAGGSVDFNGIIPAGGSATAPQVFTLFSSIGGFDEADAIVSEPAPGTIPGDISFALPDDPSFNGLTEAIEFRVFASRESQPTRTGGGIEFKNQNPGTSVVLNGEVTGTVVPEPGSLALLGLGGLLIAARRRGDA